MLLVLLHLLMSKLSLQQFVAPPETFSKRTVNSRDLKHRFSLVDTEAKNIKSNRYLGVYLRGSPGRPFSCLLPESRAKKSQRLKTNSDSKL